MSFKGTTLHDDKIIFFGYRSKKYALTHIMMGNYPKLIVDVGGGGVNFCE